LDESSQKTAKQTEDLKQTLTIASTLQSALREEEEARKEEREGSLRAAMDHDAEKLMLSKQIDQVVRECLVSKEEREQAARRLNKLRLVKIPVQKAEILSLKRKAVEREDSAKKVREIEEHRVEGLRRLWVGLKPADGLLQGEVPRISHSGLDLLVACSDWLDEVELQCEAHVWLQNLRGLAFASSTGLSCEKQALRLFEQGTKDHSDASLDDIFEMVEGLVGVPSLAKVLCPILTYIRYQGKRAKESEMDSRKAVILLRCIGLVYLHVRHSHRLQPLREEFWAMQSCFEQPARRSALVALLLGWLAQAMGSGTDRTLSSYIMARLLDELSIDLNGVRIVSCGSCVVVVCAGEVYFRWPENFRLMVGGRSSSGDG
jgi:hypothetical protein